MAGTPFSQVLKTATIDYRKEYDRLYLMFYKHKILNDAKEEVLFPLRDFCAYYFIKFPFRGTCLNLDDFNASYGFIFEQEPINFDIDYLVSFCEYSYNLVCASRFFSDIGSLECMDKAVKQYIVQVQSVIEKIGYMPNTKNSVTDFVPKDSAAIAVAEIIDPQLSYRVIEYNHHSMKGDIKRKEEIIIALAKQLEPQNEKLKQINRAMESDLFFLFNNLNIRHNNIDPNGKSCISYVAAMKDKELEQWYDDTYQMCLLAFLELEHLDRKKRIAQLKADIQSQS